MSESNKISVEKRNEFGLTDRDMTTIHGIFSTQPHVEKVLLFGSRAKGNYRLGSDIDLAIANEGVENVAFLALIDAFDDSLLPYRVGLIDLPTLRHAELKAQIERVGQVFYMKK